MDPTMDPAIGRVRLDAAKAAWLWTMIATGAIGAVVATPASIAVAMALHLLTLCVGHSVGLHRGIIHRAYRMRPTARRALAYLAVLTGLGGPLTWARLHAVRDYWQNQPRCPAYFGYRHSLPRDFVWYLHCRFEPADRRADGRLPPDVLTDPWLMFLEPPARRRAPRNCPLPPLGSQCNSARITLRISSGGKRP